MKSWIIVAGTFCTFIIAGIVVSIFTTPVEYYYGETEAYIDGAAPPQMERWEMY